MTDFSTPSDIINALANAGTYGCRALINKSSITSTAGFFHSLFQAGGQPAAGTTPTTWAVCNAATVGAWNYNYVNPLTGTTARLLQTNISISVQQPTTLYDRLGHCAGLSGNVTTAQTVTGTISTQATDNRCLATGADVIWGLEWYTATGGTAVTATISYTNQAGTSGKTTTLSLPGSVTAYRFYPITTLAAGDTSIKSLETVTLSATTGTAGNFGVTAYKYLTNIYALANATDTRDWATLAMPQVGNNACIHGVVYASGTSTGIYLGNMVIGTR